MSHLKYPVRLAEGKIENFSDFLNLIFEYGLFFKWMYFKNRPRANLLLLRSVLMVTVFSVGFFYFFYDFGLVLEGIEIDPVIALAGAVVVGYWNMIATFYKKSQACNYLHVELLKATGDGKLQTAELLSNSLAIELLTLDLWAHRKYRHLFAVYLYKSMELAYQDKAMEIADLKLPKSLAECIEYVNHGHLQAKEARILLDSHHQVLMKQNITPFHPTEILKEKTS